MLDHFALLADYNRWMNGNLHRAASTLPAGGLDAPRGAFFGSILGTLNHLVASDLIWFGRLSSHPPLSGRINLAGLPEPTSVRFTVADDLAGLRPIRERLDRMIVGFVDSLTDADIGGVFDYRRTDGTRQRKVLSSVLSHIFNHQTHHRGQATTLLYQAGIDVGVTDLLALIPDAG